MILFALFFTASGGPKKRKRQCVKEDLTVTGTRKSLEERDLSLMMINSWLSLLKLSILFAQFFIAGDRLKKIWSFFII